MRGLLITVVVLGLVALGVAFYRNWIVVDTARGTASDKDATQINITVDRAKAREDFREVREQTKDLAERARERVASLSTLEGEIVAVDAAQNQVTLMSAGQMQTLRVAKDATIQRHNEKVSLDSLKVGEKASLKYKEEEGVKVAQSITVDAKG